MYSKNKIKKNWGDIVYLRYYEVKTGGSGVLIRWIRVDHILFITFGNYNQ